MFDAITCSLRMQKALAGTACSAVIAMNDHWMRSMMALAHGMHRRSDELHTEHDYIAAGARWSDHYGKRSHDVDVEHMR
jgi:hypothetical protein